MTSAVERRRVAQRAQIALDAEHRRQPGLEVHVRGAELPGRAEDVVEDLVHGIIVPQHATISPAHVRRHSLPALQGRAAGKGLILRACGRRIEGWSGLQDATTQRERAAESATETQAGEGALPGSEEATRQMEPTPSLLRAAAISVKRVGSQRRSLLLLVAGMLVVAVAGGVAGFFVVRLRAKKSPAKVTSSVGRRSAAGRRGSDRAEPPSRRSPQCRHPPHRRRRRRRSTRSCARTGRVSPRT